MMRKNVLVMVKDVRPGDIIKDSTGLALRIRVVHFGSQLYQLTTEDPNLSLYMPSNAPVVVYKRCWQ